MAKEKLERTCGSGRIRGDGTPRSIRRRATPRSIRSRATLMLCVAAVVLLGLPGLSPLAPGSAGAAEPEILPIDQVEIGMRGVGRTVFQGDTIEEFELEILGILENARPHGDLILFRAEGERLEHTGIIQGMSGSPVYIDGKLIGAVAFAYPQTKDPIGAITPIGEMLRLFDHQLGPVREDQGTLLPSSETGDPTLVSDGYRVSSSGAGTPPASSSSAASYGGRDRFDRLWSQFVGNKDEPFARAAAPGGLREFGSVTGLPSGHPDAGPEGTNALSPLLTPVSMSGWAGPLRSEIEQTMGSLGFAATTVSSGKSRDAHPTRALEPGSSVGIQLIGGDADLVAIGTVTHVDGDRILAFGHPMIQAGDVEFPMSGAWIHAVLANRNVSHKMGSSTGLIGGIWNDRRPGVAGVLGKVPDRLPVKIVLDRDDGSQRTYQYEIVRHFVFTPFFLPWAVTNSYLDDGWVFGDAAIRTEIEVFFDGSERLRRVDRMAADAPAVVLGAEITLPATLLMINPFEETRLDSIHIRISYEKGNPSAQVLEVRGNLQRAEVGDLLEFDVTIEPFRGAPIIKRIELPIPTAWTGRSLRIHIGGTADFLAWDQDRVPEKFMIQDLSQLRRMIETVPDESVLTMRVYSTETGALIQGVELPKLPTSLASVSRNAPNPRGTIPIMGSLLYEERFATDWVITGGQTVEVEVAEH